jgi:hypothetical protein
MTLLRFLYPQGIAGIAVSLALGLMLLIQRGETSHWKKQSGQFEQLYAKEQANFAATVTNYRAAADQARAADQANAERVAVEQRAINERTANDFERRLAAARAAAERLRVENASATADPGGRSTTPMPGLPASSGGTAQAASQDGLPPSDALTATEQAIQLDELIKWVESQAKVDNNANAVASPPGD